MVIRAYFLRRKTLKNKETTLSNSIAQRNLSKRFHKITDPNYSLFTEEYKRYRFMKWVLIVFTSTGLPLFIIGLIVLIRTSIFGVIPLTFGALGVMMLIYLPIQILDYSKFKAVMEAKKSKQWDTLVDIARKYSLSYSYLEQEKARLATFLLIDEKSPEIALLLKERLSVKKPVRVREVLKAFHLLAIKLGFPDAMSLYKHLESKKPLGTKVKKPPEVEHEIVVPITKITYLKRIPEEARCMVSGLAIDFFTDEVVVCPYCSAFAKKELLMSWLEENTFCPVCRRELRINDCPEVQISSKK